MPKKVSVVSARDLSRSIDRAVAVATKRLDLKPEKPNFWLSWEIFGRIVRTEDISVAFAFATEVSRRVELQGIKAQPTCCRIDGHILAGFIERAAMAKQLTGL